MRKYMSLLLLLLPLRLLLRCETCSQHLPPRPPCAVSISGVRLRLREQLEGPTCHR
jgi:hypothetical protein